MDTASKRVGAFRSPFDQAISLQTGLMPDAPSPTMQEIAQNGLFADKYAPVSVRTPVQAPAIPNMGSALATMAQTSAAPVELAAPQQPTTNMHLFSDESQAFQKMLSDGNTKAESEAMLQARRRDIAKEKGVNLSLTDPEKAGLLKMTQDGLDTTTALDFLKKQREAENDALPFYSKVGKAGVGLGVGALTTTGKVVNNLLDFAVEPITGYKGFGEEANKYAEAQKISENTPGQGGASQVGSVIAGTGLGFLGPTPAIGGAGVKGAALRGGAYGAVYGGLNPIIDKGSNADISNIAKEAAIGGATGLIAGPLLEKAVIPAVAGVAGKVSKYAEAGIQAGKNQGLAEVAPAVGKSISRDVNRGMQSVSNFGAEKASNISNQANRLNALDEQKFSDMTGESVGEYLTKRGVNTVGEKTVQTAAQKFDESIKEADKGFATIEGNFRYQGGSDDAVKLAMEEMIPKLESRRSADANKISRYLKKYNEEGLTMSEINDLKRVYQRTNKFTYEQSQTDAAHRATSILDDIRGWQFRTAAENGFDNVADINKTTQAYKFIADNLDKKLSRSRANNAVSITDWISLSGGTPANLALFAGKKLLSTDAAKELAIRTLAKQEKAGIISSDIEAINKNNLLKKNASTASVSDIGMMFGGKSMVKPPLAIGPATGKPTMTNKGMVTPSVIEVPPNGFNSNEITPRSVVVQPGTSKVNPDVKLLSAPEKGTPDGLRTPIAGKMSDEEIIRESKKGLLGKLNFSKNTKGFINPSAMAEDLGLKAKDSTKALMEEARKYGSAEEFIKTQGQTFYHGTDKKFDKFDLSKIPENDQGLYGRGVYLSPNKEFTAKYGKNNISAYINRDANLVDWDTTLSITSKNKIKNTLEKMGIGIDTITHIFSIPPKPINLYKRMQDILEISPKKASEIFSESGIHGITVSKNGKLHEISVLDDSKIKMESQLIDIYNQSKNK